MESERRAYEYLTQHSLESDDQKTLKQLAAYPVLEDDSAIKPFFLSMVRDQSMHALGVGTMKSMRSVMKDVFLPVLFCRAYTVQEKIDFWASKFAFINRTSVKDELISTDLTKVVHSLEIPVYFFSGASDMTVNHDLSKSFLDGIIAPVKGFYTFQNSAHSPQFEEPERMLEILTKDVLAGGNSFAD
jgi:pimeloyl-ACP methyl ester carboxylesterase